MEIISGTQNVPVTIPVAPSKSIEGQPPEALDPECDEKRVKLIDHFSQTDFKLSGAENGELNEREKFWLTSECLVRYLKACKWDLHSAIQRLEDTLKWRREYAVDDITAEHVEPEAVTGKMIIFGYDVSGRPALYLIPSRQNSDGQTRQIQFTVWMLERCTELMGPGVGNIALFIDFADRAKNASMGTARKVLNILQSHYPERLGRSFIINVPFLVMAFLNLIFPFVDPVTREKIKLNPDVVEQGLMAADQAMKEWGGDIDFQYSHEVYWKELVRLCEARRGTLLQNWRLLGGKVGTSEWEIKRGEGLFLDSVAIP